MNVQRAKTLAFAASLGFLFLLTVLYWGKGIYLLTLGPDVSDAVDLRARWTEERYVLRGRNPFDIWLANSPRARSAGVAITASERDTRIDEELGLRDPAHSPWSYCTGSVLLWPPWPVVRTYFAFCNVFALLVIARWAFGQAPTDRRSWSLLASVSVLAISGNCTALEVGQYGIIVVALLTIALRLDSKDRQFGAGLMLGLAMIKPTIAGPFFLSFLVRRRFVAAAACAAYCGVASLPAWWLTGTDPIEMLRQLSSVGTVIRGDGTVGVFELLQVAGLSRRASVLGSMALVLMPALGLMALYRRADGLIGFAIAAVTARLWTYHRPYDDITLAFLLVALLVAAAHADRSRTATFGFLLVGMSLWIPGRFTVPDSVQVLQIGAWILGLVCLLRTVKPAAGQRG